MEQTNLKDDAKKFDWGHELTWAKGENYTGKILVFEKIHSKTTMQFLKDCNKTIFVNNGKFKVRWINTQNAEVFETELNEGQTFEFKALVPHQIITLSQGGSITEVGDKNVDDSIYHVVKAENIG